MFLYILLIIAAILLGGALVPALVLLFLLTMPTSNPYTVTPIIIRA